MKLAIVYHAYKNSAHLKKSLDSILLQTDQNFEFIFINDGAAPGVTKIIKEIDFSKFKKLTYFKYSQNFGHATCFNQIIATTNADYVMFVGANFIPDQAFVKTLNDIFEHNPDVDVLSFNTIKNDRQYLSFDKLNSKMNLLIDQSMKDKIFSVKLLRKHQILFNEHAYFPLLFIYQVMSQFKKWIVVDYAHAVYEKNKFFTYNFYDVFDQNDYLISNFSKSKFWHANLDLIQYFMINYVMLIFLFRFFHTYPQNATKQTALRRAQVWLDTNIPNWRNNKILNNSKNRQPEVSTILAKLKFKTNYLDKIIRKYKL